MAPKKTTKKVASKKKKAAPAKRKKGQRPADRSIQPKPVIDMNRLNDKRPFMLEDRYAMRGRPPIYPTVEELDMECQQYFEWINGIYFERDKKVRKWDEEIGDYKDEIVTDIFWIRKPEPPTITGLVLFLGFAHRSCLHEQMERGPEFSNVITRATHRVEMSYERDLRDRDMTRGAQFALPNIGRRQGWSNTQSIQNLDKEGKPTDPPKGVTVQVGSLAPNIDKNL